MRTKYLKDMSISTMKSGIEASDILVPVCEELSRNVIVFIKWDLINMKGGSCMCTIIGVKCGLTHGAHGMVAGQIHGIL